MSTQTIPTPTAAELAALLDTPGAGDDDIAHIVRVCNPDLALCGHRVPGQNYIEEAPGDDADTVWCPECVVIDRAGDSAHLAGCATCRDGGSW